MREWTKAQCKFHKFPGSLPPSLSPLLQYPLRKKRLSQNLKAGLQIWVLTTASPGWVPAAVMFSWYIKKDFFFKLTVPLGTGTMSLITDLPKGWVQRDVEYLLPGYTKRRLPGSCAALGNVNYTPAGWLWPTSTGEQLPANSYLYPPSMLSVMILI